MKIIEVVWIDTKGWDEWVDSGTDFDTCLVHTIGYEVDTCDSSVTVTQCFTDDDSYTHVLCIPMGCVKSITTIREDANEVQ